MKITVLGSRANIEESKPWHSRHAGVLVDDALLLDLGEPEFLEHGARWAFVTHLHPDHAFFVEDRDAELPIKVYAPEPHPAVEVVGGEVQAGGYTVTPVPTEHSKKVESCGYLVERDGTRIFYTGDLFWVEKQYHDMLGSPELVITEGSFLREGGLVRQDDEGVPFGHTGVPDLLRLFKRFTDRVLLIHLGSWFMDDVPEGRKKLDALAEKHDLELVVGYDGLELTV